MIDRTINRPEKPDDADQRLTTIGETSRENAPSSYAQNPSIQNSMRNLFTSQSTSQVLPRDRLHTQTGVWCNAYNMPEEPTAQLLLYSMAEDSMKSQITSEDNLRNNSNIPGCSNISGSQMFKSQPPLKKSKTMGGRTPKDNSDVSINASLVSENDIEDNEMGMDFTDINHRQQSGLVTLSPNMPTEAPLPSRDIRFSRI